MLKIEAETQWQLDHRNAFLMGVFSHTLYFVHNGFLITGEDTAKDNNALRGIKLNLNLWKVYPPHFRGNACTRFCVLGNLPFSTPLIVTQISSLQSCQLQRECLFSSHSLWNEPASMWPHATVSVSLTEWFSLLISPHMYTRYRQCDVVTPEWAGWHHSGGFEATTWGLGFPDNPSQVEQ